jgi:hypothetical protein
VLAAVTGVLQLTLTVTVWGRAWTAVAAALAGAAAVHWIAAWLIAPAMARGQTGNQLRRIGLDACARRTWPAPGPMTWFPVATSTTATGTPRSNRHEPSPNTAAANAGLFIVSAVLYSCAGYRPFADPAHRTQPCTAGRCAHNATALAVAGAALLAFSRRNDH